MKICILTPRFPYPENGGDVLRINAIASYLKSKGYKLMLCSFFEEEVSPFNMNLATSLYDEIYLVKRNKLISLFNSLSFFFQRKPIQCGYYFSRKFLNKLKMISKKESPDLYIAHLLRTAQYLDFLKLEDSSIIEMTDALSKTYLLSANKGIKSVKNLIYLFEQKLIKKYEQEVISRFKKVVLVSNKDIDYLGKKENLFCYTNGIDCKDLCAKINCNKICFVGNMRTLQNQTAVNDFIRYILPIIEKVHPDVEFHIVGAEPPVSILNLAQKKNIYVTGFVNSVEEYIKDSCMLVAPVSIAAGIQNKVLIGMACKIPVVLTSLISNAIPELKNEVNCIIEDDFSIFANSCIRLMEDQDFRNRIAYNGFDIVKNNYTWTAKLDGYEQLPMK